MEMITVEVLIPATNRVLDFALPAHVPLHKVIGGMMYNVEQGEQNVIFDRGTPLLGDLQNGRMLNLSHTLVQEGIRDGMRLMLI